MLWRERSRLARVAVIATALAVTLALLTLLAAGVGSAQGGLAAFDYGVFIAFIAICLWVAVGLRCGIRGIARRE